MARAAAKHTLRQFSRAPSVRQVASRLGDDMAAVEEAWRHGRAEAPTWSGSGACRGAVVAARFDSRRGELGEGAGKRGGGGSTSTARGEAPARQIEAAALAEWMEAARVLFQRQLVFARVAV